VAKRLKGPPSLDYLVELRTQMEQDAVVVQQRELLKKTREARERTFEVTIPERIKTMTGADLPIYRDATVADEILSLAAVFGDKPPRLILHAGGKDTPDAIKATTKVEHFTTTDLLFQAGGTKPGPKTYWRVIDATFEGGAVSQLVKVKDIWGERYGLRLSQFEDDDEDAEDGKTATQKHKDAIEKAKQRAGRSPIAWLSVDAATVLIVWYGDKIGEVFTIQKRALLSCFREYNLGLDNQGDIVEVPEETSVRDWAAQAGEKEEVDFCQHWTAEHATYFVQRTPSSSGTVRSSVNTGTGGAGTAKLIRQWRHGYNLGHPPFYFSLGATANYHDGRFVTWSVSETKRAAVEYLSWVRTMLAYFAIRDAMPPMSAEVPEGAEQWIGDDKKPGQPVPYELAAIYPMPTGGSLKPLVFPGDTRQLMEWEAKIQQDINRLGTPKAPSNLGELDSSGYAFAQAEMAGRVRLSQFEASIRDHFRDVTVDYWKLLRQLKEDVYVYHAGEKEPGWVRLNPDKDLDAAFVPEWQLDVDTTAAQIILERYLSARVSNGSLGVDQMIERLGDNIDEVRESRAKDRLRERPIYLQMEEAEVAAAWGTGDVLKAQQEADLMAQSQQAPQQQMAGSFGQGGLGTDQYQDQAAMAMSPNGAGMAPGSEVGGMEGSPASPNVQQQAATAALGGLT
jgi:hypothetical protein